MAVKIQDRGQMRGVLASLKGAWRRVAGGRGGHSATETTPEPAELQTSVDEAPVGETEAVAAPADYAVRDATPAQSVETAEGIEEPDVQPANADEPAAEEAEIVQEQIADEPAAAVLEVDDSEPVSEPLEVASAEAAKVVGAPRTPKTKAPAKVVRGSAASLATGPSPFIAPAAADGPDSSWTVAQLRALAKERGVRGYSSMSKAQLLGALNGPQA